MKKVLFIALACCATSGAFAQFSNGIGLAYFNTSASGINSTNSFGITYSPKVAVTSNDHFSVTIGLPISVGMSLHVNTSSTDENDNNSVSVMADVPLLVNLTFGAGSSKECEDKFGFFVGAGFGYHHTNGAEDDTDINGNEYENDYTLNVYGPAADAGIRLGLGHRGHNLEIRAQYLRGIDASKANIIGGGVLFNF
jgi:hypothetical protein